MNDGTLDPEFASPFPALSTGPVTSIAIQNGGEIIIAGQLALAGFPGHAVMRLFSDGKLDTNFVVTTDQFFFPSAVASHSNGKVVVGAYETGHPPITRLNADGSRDTSFAPTLGGGGICRLGQRGDHDRATRRRVFGVALSYEAGAGVARSELPSVFALREETNRLPVRARQNGHPGDPPFGIRGVGQDRPRQPRQFTCARRTQVFEETRIRRRHGPA